MQDVAVDFTLIAKAASAPLHFAAGDVIFSAGDEATDLYVVKSGTVELRLDGRVLETVGANQVFGEMALIDGAPRSATAVALDDVELAPIGEKQFLFLVSQTPYFALNVLRVLARRLRTANVTPHA